MKAEFSQLRGEVRQMLDAGASRQQVIDQIAKSGWSVGEFTALNKSGPAETPSQPLAYGPAASRQPMQQGPTKKQTEDFNSAVTARNDMVASTGRMRELLEEGGGQTAMFGDRAKRMGIAAQQIVTSLGALGNAGVLQPSDIDRFTKMFGDPTSLTGYLGNVTGISPLAPALDELDGLVATKVRNRASEAGVKVFSTDEEADAGVADLPPGAMFVGPDGRQYRKGQ